MASGSSLTPTTMKCPSGLQMDAGGLSYTRHGPLCRACWGRVAGSSSPGVTHLGCCQKTPRRAGAWTARICAQILPRLRSSIRGDGSEFKHAAAAAVLSKPSLKLMSIYFSCAHVPPSSMPCLPSVGVLNCCTATKRSRAGTGLLHGSTRQSLLLSCYMP